MRLAVVPIASLLALGLAVGCGGGGDDGGGADPSALEDQPWVLISGIDLPEGAAAARPSVTFAGGTVAGSTGCNRYTAGYTVDGESLEIGRIALTQMACPPPADAIERDYVAAFEQVAGWRIDGDELVLFEPDGTDLLRYRPASPEGDWEVTGILREDAFTSPLLGTELTARFAPDGALSGSAGCNTYTASYTRDGGAIEITAPAATRKACPEPEGIMEQEAAYLAALEAAASFSVDGSVLELLAADGTRVVTYAQP